MAARAAPGSRRPPSWFWPVAAVVAAVLLWALAGYSWLVPAVLIGSTLLVRLLGFVLPHGLRDRMGRSRSGPGWRRCY